MPCIMCTPKIAVHTSWSTCLATRCIMKRTARQQLTELLWDDDGSGQLQRSLAKLALDRQHPAEYQLDSGTWNRPFAEPQSSALTTVLLAASDLHDTTADGQQVAVEDVARQN